MQSPSGGTYYLQVRDTTYSGNAAWSYALHGVTGPVATSVFPLAVNPGTTANLELTGSGNDASCQGHTESARGTRSRASTSLRSPSQGGTLPVPLLVTPSAACARSRRCAGGRRPQTSDQAPRRALRPAGRAGRHRWLSIRCAEGRDLCVRSGRPPRRFGMRPGPAGARRQGLGDHGGRRHHRAGQGRADRMESAGRRAATRSRSPTCTTAAARASDTCSRPRRPPPTSQRRATRT